MSKKKTRRPGEPPSEACFLPELPSLMMRVWIIRSQLPIKALALPMLCPKHSLWPPLQNPDLRSLESVPADSPQTCPELRMQLGRPLLHQLCSMMLRMHLGRILLHPLCSMMCLLLRIQKESLWACLQSKHLSKVYALILPIQLYLQALSSPNDHQTLCLPHLEIVRIQKPRRQIHTYRQLFRVALRSDLRIE